MNPSPPSASAEDILPPAEPPWRGHVTETWQHARGEWPRPNLPGPDAPNVLVILLDDLGFGHASAFGGPIRMPSVDRLAREGVRYNNFHTAALCSPSRAALLTGRNHHSVGFAGIAEMSTPFPGANAYLPRSAATIAEVLKQHGYNTMALGKWHLVPAAHGSAAGPFDRWPLGMGFERYYGFLPGECDQWHPMLTCDNHRIPVPETPGYHLSEDLAKQAIGMLRNQQQVASGRPFFMYLAFGAPHCPFHVPREYIERYHGQFDQGWDAVREETFARQKAIGIIPADCTLPARNPGIPAWNELDADTRRLFCRLQETFCGFVEHTDAQIGRVLDALDHMGIADNTIVMFASDNGASQEGGVFGTTNTERFRNLMPMSVQEMLADFDRIGGPDTDPHYPAGWGATGNVPFKRWKRDTHRGGNTDPLVVRWPARIKDHGAVRSHYTHVTDIYPTLLEAIGLPIPRRVNGVDQMPVEGTSFAASLADGSAPRAKQVQYYEMMGSRAIWADGWTAVTWHKAGTDWKDDPWELYHQDQDYTQNNDLAAQYPDKLAQLIARWYEEAHRHNVFPLDDRGRERSVDPTRPMACQARARYVYYPDTAPVPFNAIPRLVRRRHSITAHLHLPRGGAEGVLMTEGSSFGGWSLFVQDGHGYYVHNCMKMSMHVLRTRDPLPEGPVVLRFEFEPTGAKGGGTVNVHRPRNDLAFNPIQPARGNGRLLVNGVLSATLEDIYTAPMMYSFVVEGFQIGASWGTPVAYEHYQGRYAFGGGIDRVEVEVEPLPAVEGARA